MQQKEEEFHLKQARVRSKIRLVEGREKPIDILAKNIILLTHDSEKERGIFVSCGGPAVCAVCARFAPLCALLSLRIVYITHRLCLSAAHPENDGSGHEFSRSGAPGAAPASVGLDRWQ